MKVLALRLCFAQIRQQIATLQARVDSLGTEVRTLGAKHYQAYYVIGTEQELMAKGIVVMGHEDVSRGEVAVHPRLEK